MLYVFFSSSRGILFHFAHTGVRTRAVPSSYDHTRVKAPHPIRTAKLSTLGPDQYFGRGLQGNLGCCKSFLFFLFLPAGIFSAKILQSQFFCAPEKLRSGDWAVYVAPSLRQEPSERDASAIFMKQRKELKRNF